MMARDDRQSQGGRRQSGPRGLRLAQLLVVTDETDEHGRLLLEDSAPPAAARRASRAGVAMTQQTCPYDDTPSRRGGQMNAAAYEAVRRDTRHVLDGFAWLGANYAAMGLGRRDTPEGLADITKLGVTLPLVLFHRAREAVARQGQLPSFVASIFKASRGMFSAAVDLAAQAPDAATTPREVVAFAERGGHLRRAQTGRVCAAPTRLIERTLAAIRDGTGADASASQLAALVAFPTLAEFFAVESGFSRSLAQYGSMLEQVAANTGARDPAALFGARMRVDAEERTFGELTESFLAFATDAQAALNRVLGRADNAPPVRFQDVIAAL